VAEARRRTVLWVAGVGGSAGSAATVVRSLKRVLVDSGAGTMIQIGGRTAPLLELLNGIASAFRVALVETSTLH